MFFREVTEVKLPVISGGKVIKVLLKAGFEIVGRKGSHVRLRKIISKERVIVVTVPDHKELAYGTLNDIIKRSEIPKKEFLKKLK